jgi:hypothetical protein
MSRAEYEPEPVMPPLEGTISTHDLRIFLRDWWTWRAWLTTREQEEDETFLRYVTHIGETPPVDDAG